ncbi:MAG TPA: hypothetical protein VMB81_19870 [Candidatus Sulfotelmatobacter sp.]|nr:hypothetical protein [Candidatus Sulfotelmatobacter sp.]
MTRGVLGSSALHLLVVLLLIFGWPWLIQVPPTVTPIIVVNLVSLGEETAARSSGELASLPQEKAEEAAKLEPVEAVPVAEAPPPAGVAQRQRESSPHRLTTSRMAPKPDIARTTTDSRAATKLPGDPSPDDLGARLSRLAKLQQPDTPIPSSPRRPLNGSGLSNLSATSVDAAAARDATYGVKDFIRAQVERRWHVDNRTLASAGAVVAIHIMLNRDGSVSRAEIVDNPSRHSDSAYRELALSARNAVLLSSPLAVPSGQFERAKDMVLNLDAREASQ